MNGLPTLAQQPCSVIKGVGANISQLLAKLNIFSVQDLLFHLPYRYQNRANVVSISALSAGMLVTIEGEVLFTELKQGNKKQLVSRISDGSGTLDIRFFNVYASLQKQLQPGNYVRCFGEVKSFNRFSPVTMIHPDILSAETSAELPEIEQKLTPIYSITEGLTQARIQKLMEQALRFLDNGYPLQDYLSTELRAELGLVELSQSIQFLHRPSSSTNMKALEEFQHPFQQRLIIEELTAHQLSLLKLRARGKKYSAFPMLDNKTLCNDFIQQLPFNLTQAQQRVVGEIFSDMEKTQPMMRLVQGDVGSGKTVVAMLAMLKAIEAGFQAVLMAPTEILAEQHFANCQRWFAALGVKVAWLSGKQNTLSRRENMTLIASGEAQAVVGTHALFQKEVNFYRLGVVVIDEQHRFGVEQRLQLWEKGNIDGLLPHQLIMTATPIPRTLAMTAYADLDYSVIDELPPGRKPVMTTVIDNKRRDEIIERIRHICQQGRQVYWVCTLIEESEVLQSQAAEESFATLSQSLGEFRVGLVHGRMKAKEKDDVMQAFKKGELDLLVATTVIEVGVDVPNAILMIIENPERLGLSQLHQLRGRVGRGSDASYCVLMYQSPLSGQAISRLQIMRETNDGFVIAQKDLALRGPGEMLGTRQTGLCQFRFADLTRDQNLVTTAHQLAHKILVKQPEVIEALVKRWVGHSEQFLNA